MYTSQCEQDLQLMIGSIQRTLSTQNLVQAYLIRACARKRTKIGPAHKSDFVEILLYLQPFDLFQILFFFGDGARLGERWQIL